MNIRQDFIPKGHPNRPGNTITPQYLVIHWTANTKTGADAQRNRNYFARPFRQAAGKFHEAYGTLHPFRYAVAHYLVDDKQNVQALSDTEMGYHVGANTYRHPFCRNANSIGIEMCVNEDGDFAKMEERTVRLAGSICKKWGINPLTRLVRHYDVTGKECPKFYVESEKDWEEFKARVLASMKGETNMPFLEKEKAERYIIWLKEEYYEEAEDKRKMIGEIADVLRVASGQQKQNV